ncbi:MAG: acyltransferase [Planctomycetota bacterium]
MAAGAATTPSERVAALDGLRGVAILWVLWHQLVVIPTPDALTRLVTWPASVGWVGVQLFFVLSGFLITGVLLDTRDAPRRASSFYARRALRILPLYLLLLTVVFGAAASAGGGLGVDRLSRWQVAGYWLLLGNWSQMAADDLLIGPLAVTWSVAIEEQFYLLWPLVVWTLPRRAFAVTCCLLVAAAVGFRLWALSRGWGDVSVYVATPGRLDALAIGAIAAVAARSEWNPPAWVTPLAVTCVVSAAAIDLVGSLAADGPTYFCPRGSLGVGMTLGAIAAGALVGRMADGRKPIAAARWLEADWLRSWGRYSYGVYLTHGPIRAVVRDHLYGPGIDASPLVAFPAVGGSLLPAWLVYVALCLPLCWLAGKASYKLVERPALRLKRRFPAGESSQPPVASSASSDSAGS